MLESGRWVGGNRVAGEVDRVGEEKEEGEGVLLRGFHKNLDQAGVGEAGEQRVMVGEEEELVSRK